MIKTIDGFQIGNNNPIDSRYVFSSVTEALNDLSSEVRYKGLFIYIEELSKFYYFKGGIGDSDFVPFDASDLGVYSKSEIDGRLIKSEELNYVQTLTSMQSLPDGVLDGAVSGLEIEGLSIVNEALINDSTTSINHSTKTLKDNELIITHTSSTVAYSYAVIQPMHVKSDDELFAYARLKVDTNNCDYIYINLATDIPHRTTVTNPEINKWYEIYKKCTATVDVDAQITILQTYGTADIAAGKKLTIDKNSVSFLNLTQLGLTHLSEAELLTLCRSGISGLQGVDKPSVKVVGKNLLYQSEFEYAWLLNSGEISYRDGRITSGFIPVLKDETYIFSKNGVAHNTNYYMYDKSKKYIERSIAPTYKPVTDGYIRIYNSVEYMTGAVQLEKGASATPYEPYRSSTLTTDVELKSLPNGVKDRIYMQDGNLILEKRVGEHIFKTKDFKRLFTALTNNDLLETVDNVFKDSCVFNTEKNGWVLIEGVNQIRQAERELSTSIGSFHTTTPSNGIDFIFNKGKYADLESAVNDYVGRKAFYLLATPEIINLTAQGLTDGILESIKGGTCIVDSDTFIPPLVKFGVPADLGAQMSSAIATLGALSKSLAAKADRVQEEWIEPTLINGWVNYDDTRIIKFIKDEFGFVHLEGIAKAGAIGHTICKLPAGYRPISAIHVPIYTQNGIGELIIYGDGYINLVLGSNLWASLTGISFAAER